MSTVFGGAAGTATIQLTIPREENEITTKTLEGCLVKKDANLGIFVQTNLKDQSGDMDKLKQSEYLFYSPDSDFQGDVTKATLTYPKISKKRGETRQKMKDCTVEDPLIIRVHGHLFLCCDSQLSQSKFLDKHCKKVRISQSLDCSKTFYGLGSEEDGQLVFTSFGMSQCQSSNGLYKIKECSDYEKLKDAGPLLPGDNKTAVGCFRKTNDCRILVSIFGSNQEGKRLIKVASQNDDGPLEEKPVQETFSGCPGCVEKDGIIKDLNEQLLDRENRLKSIPQPMGRPTQKTGNGTKMSSPLTSHDSPDDSKSKQKSKDLRVHSVLRSTSTDFPSLPSNDTNPYASSYGSNTGPILQPRCDCETLIKSMLQQFERLQELKTKFESLALYHILSMATREKYIEMRTALERMERESISLIDNIKQLNIVITSDYLGG